MQSLINLPQLSGTKGLSVLKIDIEATDNFDELCWVFFLCVCVFCH